MLRELGISAWADGRHDFILNRYRTAKDLKRYCHATYNIEKNGNATVAIDSANYRITVSEDIFILSEIYLEGDYDLALPGEAVIWDIGMNVGYSSIFLASQLPKANIVSFEPLSGIMSWHWRTLA